MSMVTDKMIGEYKDYYMYVNNFGMYYFSELVDGYFVTKTFDTIDGMKDYIDSISK